jgi:hypothetical protein
MDLNGYDGHKFFANFGVENDALDALLARDDADRDSYRFIQRLFVNAPGPVQFSAREIGAIGEIPQVRAQALLNIAVVLKDVKAQVKAGRLVYSGV